MFDLIYECVKKVTTRLSPSSAADCYFLARRLGLDVCFDLFCQFDFLLHIFFKILANQSLDCLMLGLPGLLRSGFYLEENLLENIKCRLEEYMKKEMSVALEKKYP